MAAGTALDLYEEWNLRELNHTTENANRVQHPGHRHITSPYFGTTQSEHFHRLFRCNRRTYNQNTVILPSAIQSYSCE